MSDASAHFLFCAKEAFGLYRRGVVFRGTVLQGAIRVGQHVLVPGTSKEHTACVAFIEFERKSIIETRQGVELGLLLTQFEDPDLTRIIELGFDSPESIPPSPQELLGLNFPLHIRG